MDKKYGLIRLVAPTASHHFGRAIWLERYKTG